MEVKQIYQLMNTVTSEVLGESDIVAEDLQNVVDVGTKIFDANAVDNYVKSLIDHIGKVIFVNRPYSGVAPSVLMDGWEFGSVLEKVEAEIPKATENPTWNLVDGEEYKQDVFTQPKVTAKFFNNKITFEVPISITERQVKESFNNAEQLNGFLSMIYNAVEKSMTIKIDSLVMRTINNMIAETIASDYKDSLADLTTKSGIKAVNLLFLFNQKFNSGEGATKLTADKALTNKEFIRFAVYTMDLYRDRLTRISTLFNVEGKPRFTPNNLLHVVLLSDFVASTTAYLQSDTYHNDLIQLPKFEKVPYWQGSGKDYSFANVSDIHVTTANNEEVVVSGVLGVMFDRDALGVCNVDRRTKTAYNARGEFFNSWYKYDCQSFNSLEENAVVFFVE